MVVTTTSAASLAAGQARSGLPGEERPRALFVMVVLAGAFQILLGLLRLGRLTRFVSYSVMTVLTQLPTVTGYEPTEGSTVTETSDLLVHVGQVNPLSLGMAAVALALAVVLPQTALGNVGQLAAILAPSALVVLFDTGAPSASGTWATSPVACRHRPCRRFPPSRPTWSPVRSRSWRSSGCRSRG